MILFEFVIEDILLYNRCRHIIIAAMNTSILQYYAMLIYLKTLLSHPLPDCLPEVLSNEFYSMLQ